MTITATETKARLHLGVHRLVLLKRDAQPGSLRQRLEKIIHPFKLRSTFNQVLKRVIRLMKIGFICLNVPGHLNPMTTLARHLQYRNHEVVFLYSSGAAGLPFVPGPEKDHFNENNQK